MTGRRGARASTGDDATQSGSASEAIESYRVDSIERAAISVIARKGLHATTIQDVADEAGIAKGTVYLYFRDRDELFTRTAQMAFDTILEDTERAIRRGGSFADRLTRVVLRPLELLEEREGLVLAALALSEREEGSHAATSRFHARFRELLQTLLVEGQRNAELRLLDPSAVAAIMLDCLRGAIVRRLGQPAPLTREKEAELIVSVLLQGLATSRD